MAKLNKEIKEWLDDYVDHCDRELGGLFKTEFSMSATMAMEMNIDYAEAREIVIEYLGKE